MDLEPQADEPPVQFEARNIVGWVSLAVVFSFLCLVALSGYFSTQRKSSVTKSEAERALKTRVQLGSLVVTPETDLGVQAARLRPLLDKDAEAELIYAAIQSERHAALPPGALNALKGSAKPFDAAIYEIYSNKTLAPDRARYLAGLLPKERFVYKVAGVHAMEKAGIPDARSHLGTEAGASILLLCSLGIVLFFGVGLILLFAYVVARAAGQLRPFGLPLGNLTLVQADRVAARSAQLFLFYIGVQFAAVAIVSVVPKNFIEVPLYLATIVGFILISRVPVAGMRLNLPELGIRREKLGEHILWGIGGAIANVPVFLTVAYVSTTLMKGLPAPEHPVNIEMQDATSKLMFLKILFTTSVAAPIVEEILFRGTFFPALASVLKSPLWAGVITSLIFGMIHPTGIPAWAPLACIGGMSCFLSYQTRSLVPSIVMHAVHNFGTLVFGYLLLR